MFECGLEGVGIKIVKRSHFEKSENSKDEINLRGEGNVGNINLNELYTQASAATASTSTATDTSKAESAWRLITKKPPTPKTPKEKFAHALESIIVTDKDSSSKEKVKVTSKTSNECADETDKGKFKKEDKPESQSPKVKDTDKTSSCVIELKSVWFNFAAPPCVPITRKIDFSRLDWNLLSTASPAITAWMNPSNRLAIKVVAMLRTMHMRHTAVAAALMADALENEKIQRNPKMKKSSIN